MISVCITTYNGEKYIKEQIASILHQLNLEDEIIISDDGSTDQTLSLIKSFDDQRIRIFHHDNSQYINSEFRFNLTTRNMENALHYANGDYIFMADQDDIWCDKRVETVLPLLIEYSLVVNDCSIIDENGEISKDSYFDLIGARSGIVRNLIKNSYLGCCMAFKKDIFRFIYPFPKEAIPHDIWIGLISELYGKVLFCHEKLILYRRHGNNLSNSAQSSSNSLIFKLKYRMLLIKALFYRGLMRK